MLLKFFCYQTTQKGSFTRFFFGIVKHFPRNFLMSPKDQLFFFSVLCYFSDFKKKANCPPSIFSRNFLEHRGLLWFFGTMRHIKHIFLKQNRIKKDKFFPFNFLRLSIKEFRFQSLKGDIFNRVIAWYSNTAQNFFNTC